MKRKFLAKAITLGLMLAVPFGVEAESLSRDSIVDGDKKIYNESTSIEGNQHDYTVKGQLNIINSSSYVKNVKKLTIVNLDNKGTIEADEIEIKSTTMFGNPNHGTITVRKFTMPKDTAYLTNEGTINVTDNGNGIFIGRAIINRGTLTADNIEVSHNVANSKELTVNNLLDITGDLKNGYGASVTAKDLKISQASDDAKDSWSAGNLKITGKMTLKDNANFVFQKNSEGNFGSSNINELITTDNNTIRIEEGVTGISVGTLKGKNTTISVASDATGQINIGTNNDAGLTIKSSSEMTDSYGDDIAGGLNKLKGTVGIAEGNKNTTLKLASGSVTGEVTGYTNKNGDLTGYSENANEYNAGISEMASIGLMAWRAENNDMNKRLGELRSSQGEHGVWTRMVRGQSKYGAQNIKNQYSTYQLGYDEKLSVDKHWTVGAAVSYTDASSSFTTGSGKNKSTGLAVYGSYLGDNGSFVDLIAKVARLKNEFDVLGGAGKGDYETNGYSISAEYGKRFTKDNGFWIEPQVELTYGYVGAVDYLTSNDVNVRQNGMDSLVGRIGFSLGRDIKAGNVYARASYLYDFDGETDVTFSKGGAVRGYKQDLGGSWWEVGVGTNINLSDATHLYFDVEKTYGGNVATPWQWNAGVRWSF